MKRELDELFKWFESRQEWLRDAARRLIERSELTADEIIELRDLCLKENNVKVKGREDLNAEPLTRTALTMSDTRNALHLNSMANVKGIDALSPKQPLTFGQGQLSIVYGPNGTGKSGYIRILKQACGVRDARELFGNVFKAPPKEQTCDITYSLDGVDKQITWSPEDGPNDDLKTCALYDSARADLYVNEENEVTFEPPTISLLRRLAKVCDLVKASINDAIERKTTKKPELPDEYGGTVAGRWYDSLTHTTSKEEVDKHCTWTEEDEEDLKELKQRLKTPDPAEQAKKLRKVLGHLQKLITSLQQTAAGLSDAIVNEIYAARSDAKKKRKAAEDAAKVVFANAPLTGVGTETWIELWEQARAFSEAEAYPKAPFPNIASEAACVLCQQPLSATAKERYRNFEEFVKGGMETAAKAAEAKVTKLLNGLVEVPGGTTVGQQIELAEIIEEDLEKRIRAQYASLANRRQGVIDNVERDNVTALPNGTLVGDLQKRAEGLAKRIKQFEDDAAKDNRPALQKAALELEARKWCSQKKKQVEEEIARLNLIQKLKAAARSADTSGITSQSTKLSALLITDAFATRFQEELKKLGAGRLQVQIEKSGSSKGVIKHRIKLTGIDDDIESASILSEGEFRIVSIAAFLADVESRGGSTPFLFDDPISSMDEDYEYKVAKRLVELAKGRQVIVFTHRLTLLNNLDTVGTKEGLDLNLVALRRLPNGGTGDTSGIPIWADKPDKVLNALISDRLAKLKKLKEADDVEAYGESAKALCSDFRIVVERLFETELLSDVVRRFRREVMTKGKLKHLPLIEASDCKLLDDLMTDYSFFEHSQPEEAPVQPPEFEKLKADMERLQTWVKGWKARKEAA